MKTSYTFYIVLVLIICISLFSCQKSTNEKEITSSEITQDTTTPKETEKETEAMEFSNYYMISDSKDFDAARDDLKRVKLHVGRTRPYRVITDPLWNKKEIARMQMNGFSRRGKKPLSLDQKAKAGVDLAGACIVIMRARIDRVRNAQFAHAEFF